jgi:hypothetical protein
VKLENRYPSSPTPTVVYRAFWQAVAFPEPVAPGASSTPLATIAASANTAYVLLAPGWETGRATPPTALVVTQSRTGFGVHLNETLTIPVDDTTFEGNCAAGSFLTQGEANFIVQRVFQAQFAGLKYDPASCTTAPAGDGGSG